jgi:hypothetical protein
MTHLSTVLLKIKRQQPNLLMKILSAYINGPVIGELRLMQQKLSPCYFLGTKWLLYHPYSLMGPSLKRTNVDPWGTPALTVFHLEKHPSIFTLCFLSYRKLSIHFRTIPQIPYFRSLKIKPECQTRSYALTDLRTNEPSN